MHRPHEQQRKFVLSRNDKWIRRIVDSSLVAASSVLFAAAGAVHRTKPDTESQTVRLDSKSLPDVRRAIALAVGMFVSAPLPAGADPLPRVAGGFTIEEIASIPGARELAAAPNGDLFVGTGGKDVYIVPRAETSPGAAQVFAKFDDSPAAGVALSGHALYVGTQFGIYKVEYQAGDVRARALPVKLSAVRTSGTPGHSTTTVAVRGTQLFASVGSSCNACKPEADATRATIQSIDLRSNKMTTFAERIRNAIALTVNPATSALWAGVAGVDDLQPGHPYEIFDDVTAHAPPVDYGWPTCYENRKVAPMWPGSCDNVAIPRVIIPAYATPIGAVFYPMSSRGRYAFPSAYRGGAFVTLHGSWHGPSNGLPGYVPPRVVFVPMRGDTPAHAADWDDPNTQWTEFVGGYQQGGSHNRIGRPTGITVGSEGSLFVADDETGAIYRIRPKEKPVVFFHINSSRRQQAQRFRAVPTNRSF